MVPAKSSLKSSPQPPQHVFTPPKSTKVLTSAAQNIQARKSASTSLLNISKDDQAKSNRALLNSLEDDDDNDNAMEVAQPSFTGDSNSATDVPVPEDTVKVASESASLPEGFFDDPKQDAKVRGIEFVDPEEAEWARFVKEIASEEVQSESIQVIDEEESRKERELEEIEEMMTHWQKVIDLEKKKETRVKKTTAHDEHMESSDDEDMGDELDWRVKKVSQTR